MRAILQRVRRAAVRIDGETTAQIGPGLMILLGVTAADSEATARYMALKTAELRIFSDSDDKMNLSLLDTGGAALVVSQFTLYGDCKKGRRPSYIAAARPEQADPLYRCYTDALRAAGVPDVQTGVFGADMLVSIENDGPVTLWLDSDVIMPAR